MGGAFPSSTSMTRASFRLAVHGHLKDVERNLLCRRLIAVERITELSPGVRVLVPKKKVE